MIYRIQCTHLIVKIMLELDINNIKYIPESFQTLEMCENAILHDPDNFLYCGTISCNLIKHVIANGNKASIKKCSKIDNLPSNLRLDILQKHEQFIVNYIYPTKEEYMYIIKKNPNNIIYVEKNSQKKSMCKIAIKHNFINLDYCKHIPRKLLWTVVKKDIKYIKYYKFLTKPLTKHIYKIYGDDMFSYMSKSQMTTDIIEYLYFLHGETILQMKIILDSYISNSVIIDAIIKDNEYIDILEKNICILNKQDFDKVCNVLFSYVKIDGLIKLIFKYLKNNKFKDYHETDNINATNFVFKILNNYIKYNDLEKYNKIKIDNMIKDMLVTPHNFKTCYIEFEEHMERYYDEVIKYCTLDRIIGIHINNLDDDSIKVYDIKYVLCAMKVYPGVIKKININDIDNDIAIQFVNSIYNANIY